MPSRRPAPLSEAALFAGRSGAPQVVETLSGPLGETNDGVPLPVKNTFIDVPSGLTPNMQSAQGARTQMLQSAPAELNFAPGFIKRAVLASSTTEPAVLSTMQCAKDGLAPATPCSATSQRGCGIGVPVQRPTNNGVLGSGLPSTPMATPSPTGNSIFTSYRYQLFGGPAPVQEATHSALAPIGASATHGPPKVASSGAGVVGEGVLQLPSGPLIHVASSTPAGGVSNISPAPASYSRPAASAAQFIGHEQLLKEREGEDDDDDSEDDEERRQQAQQQAAGVTRIEDAPKPPPDAKHPSMGSSQHDEGTCKRCCFFPRNRCLNGYNCEFCHYDHEKRKRKSKKKKKKEKDATLLSAEATSAPSGGTLLLPPEHAAYAAAPQIPPPNQAMMLGVDGRFLVGAESYHTPSPAYSSFDLGIGQGSAVMATAPPTQYQVPSVGPQVPSTVSAPSYFAPATGSATHAGLEAESIQYLGTQPVVPPAFANDCLPVYSALHTYATPQLGYQPQAAELAGPPLHDARLLTSPYENAVPTAAATETSGQSPSSVGPLATAPVPPAPRGPWAPPVEAPKLPQEVQVAEANMAPPPVEPPRAFPPTPKAALAAQVAPVVPAPPAAPATVVPAAATALSPPSFAPSFPSAPPPMSSPKLPKDMTLSLQEATPPAPSNGTL